jgi:hypothetical protein
MLALADEDESGQVRLIDGRTGEYFDRKITVGYKYLLKHDMYIQVCMRPFLRRQNRNSALRRVHGMTHFMPVQAHLR